MYIIVYKESGESLNIDQKFIGPFTSNGQAYNFLCEMPAPKVGGHKYIQELLSGVTPEGVRS